MIKRYILAAVVACGIGACSKHETADSKRTAASYPGATFSTETAKTEPYVLMISIDGYRHDYTQKYKPIHISEIAKNGVQADSLIPSFPTLTFPNHVTLVTGRYPMNHGIVGNFFYSEADKRFYKMIDREAVNDGSWYHGEPLWVTAENNGVTAATMFWVGSEAYIGGKRATYTEPYEDKKPTHERVEKIKEWLSLPLKQRPRFLTLYFSIVDSAGHGYGPDSPEVESTIAEIDTAIGELKNFADEQSLPLNFIIVSDHGMKNIDQNNFVYLNELTDTSPFVIGEKGAVTQLYSDDEALIEKAQIEISRDPRLKVYRRNTVPAELHFRDNPMIGDLVIVADPGVYVGVQRRPDQLPTSAKAGHGWMPSDPDLHGVFYADGPHIADKKSVRSFKNVDVYPFVLKLLRLKTKVPFDGNPDTLAEYVTN